MGSEQRRAPRFTVSLPVKVEGEEGVTSNVSISGVLFETKKSYAVGAPIKFRLTVSQMGPVPVSVECEGRVVRVDRHEGKNGIAVEMTSYGFQGAIIDESMGK